MSRYKPRILIVDDEPKFVSSLTAILVLSGYEILSASNGSAAVEIAWREKPSLILLDVRMPNMDGYEVCRRIREFFPAPIIMLTALSQKSDIVFGLDVGADDYLTKPFSTDELLARIHSALRRTGAFHSAHVESSFQSGSLLVDYVGSRVYIDQREIHLTNTEFSILCELTREAGRVVSTKVILENVWGAGYEGESHLVQRVMNRLRSKIEPYADGPRFIITRPGLGYLIDK